MVSEGDGIISGETSLKIGATADLDARVEELEGGFLRRIPEPTSKGGRLAQHVLRAYDDIGYRNVLSALGINGEALMQAVSDSSFTQLSFFSCSILVRVSGLLRLVGKQCLKKRTTSM